MARSAIGKTRRVPPADETAPDGPAPDRNAKSARDPGPARGVLRSRPAAGRFHHARVAPPDVLQGVIQHFWIVRWDLRGQLPQQRETLPHPNVQLIVERGLTRVFGVHTARFTRVLEGEGCVFGVKFRPGGFHPFLRRPLSTLADTSLSLADAFGPDSERLEDHVLDCADDIGMIEVASRFLESRPPPLDANVDLVAGIVERIEREHDMTTVDAVVAGAGIGKRALQRLFNEYVGVGPKWVINRFRLHEAIERLAAGQAVDWSRLALDLGYFDQAHFIRDFRGLVGRTPAAYARETAERSQRG